ncbi:MAG: hypothetical protein WCG94_03235 [Methanothrix sp.]
MKYHRRPDPYKTTELEVPAGMSLDDWHLNARVLAFVEYLCPDILSKATDL